MAEHLETILHLVAEGKLSAADAEPLLAALVDSPVDDPLPNERAEIGHADDETSEWQVPPLRPAPRLPPLPPAPPLRAMPPLSPKPPLAPDAPEPPMNARRQLRIEVVEGGQRVVNVRIPLVFAGMAAGLVPGLSSDHADQIREAIRSGAVGPILEVHGDDGDRVVIATE